MAVETISSRRPVPAARHPGLASAGIVARSVQRGALIWGAVFGLTGWVLVTQFGKEYPTAAARARLVKTMGSNVGLQAIFGPSPRSNASVPAMAAAMSSGWR